MDSELRAWGREEFGSADLGDSRLVRRAVRMAAAAAARPGARILDVFQTSAERQGAYDFLENSRFEVGALAASMFAATAQRCSGESYVFIPTDGSSVSLVDHQRTKDFGAVGSTKQRGRGIKVINALAVSEAGVPLGLLSQRWWTRAARKKRSDCHRRPLQEKETQHWVDAIEESRTVLRTHAPDACPWFVLDREGDKRHLLELLDGLKDTEWTVRSSYNRRLSKALGDQYLLDALRPLEPLASYELRIPRGGSRAARTVLLDLRATEVTLRLRDRKTEKLSGQRLFVVEALERNPPKGQAPLAWRLLTSHQVETAEDAMLVVWSYVQRWRVEDFHKTWKSGACDVEGSQLRRKSHALKWCTFMAAVAVRIERIKVLSREQPDLPASHELKPYEIRALILMKREHKKRTETIPDSMPTLAQATLWLAELGGYTGKSSGGPPGSITIRRGLDFIKPAAIAIEALEKAGKLR
jgi:Transposase DNA-binding/Transposase Tn5 dimerisation domain